MNDEPFLDNAQKDLLTSLVEAERSLPSDKRGKFIVIRDFDSPSDMFIHQAGPQVDGNLQDAEILASCGLLAHSFGPKGNPQFWVTPHGNAYYEEMRHSDTPAEAIEAQLRSHLSSQEFRNKYSDAFQKWSNAEKLLWSPDSLDHLSMIGHLCREAMQLFADRFASLHSPKNLDARHAETVKKIRAVLDGF